MNKLLAAISVLTPLYLGGCQTVPVSKYSPVTQSSKVENASSLVICRTSSILMAVRDISVFVNDEYVSELSNGQVKEVYLSEGPVKLDLVFPSDVSISKRSLSNTIDLGPGETKYILFGSNLNDYVPLVIPGISLGVLRFSWASVPVTRLPKECNERTRDKLKKP